MSVARWQRVKKKRGQECTLMCLRYWTIDSNKKKTLRKHNSALCSYYLQNIRYYEVLTLVQLSLLAEQDANHAPNLHFLGDKKTTLSCHYFFSFIYNKQLEI